MNKIKNIFKTPKKAVAAVLCLLVALGVIGAGSALAVSTVDRISAIGEYAAQQFAFVDSGTDPAAAAVKKAEFEYENGQFIYEVEFVADGLEYEYQVKADDGTIVFKKAEPVDRDEIITDAQLSGAIGIDAAKEIALQDAGLKESDVTFTKSYLDNDDGILIYDVAFISENSEYEYEIHGENGVILDKTVEKPDLDDKVEAGLAEEVFQSEGTDPSIQDQNPAGKDSYIGVDAAKEYALQDAGLTIDSVTFTKAKFENDDGKAEYEVEFYKDGTEYEYTIDASSGKILDRDVENDD